MIDNYDVVSKAYLVLSDGTNLQVYSIPAGSTVTVDTGRGGPDPSLVYSGTSATDAKAAESLP